jgi:hydroxypyruvate isomerase
MPRFSAHVGYLFPDRPLLERFAAVAAVGFKAVDMPAPYEVPAAALAEAVKRNGLTPLGINTPRLCAGDRQQRDPLHGRPRRRRRARGGGAHLHR